MHQQLEMAFSEAKGAKASLVKWATRVSGEHYNDILQGQILMTFSPESDF